MFDAGAIVSRLKLDTGDFDSVASQVQNKVDAMGQVMQRSGQQMYMVSRQINMVGRNLAFFGTGIVAPMILAFKSAEKYSTSVRQEMERLNNVTIQMRVAVAEALVPVMRQLSNVMADLLNRWNKLSPAMQQNLLQSVFIAGEWLLLGGLALNLVGKIGQVIARLWEFGGAIISFTAKNPEIALTVAALLGIAFAIEKIGGMNVVLNGLERIGLMIARNWTIAAMAAIQLAQAVLTLQDPFNIWSKKVKQSMQIMTAALFLSLDQINQKINDLGKGKNGALVGVVDDLRAKVDAIKGLFSGLGKTEFKIPDKIYEASKTFAEGWHDAIEDANHSLHDWGAMATSIVEQTTQEMQSALSNLFQNVLKGQLNSAKDFFVEWGNFVLKIIGDVIAQIITAKIVGAAMGMFNLGTGYTANIAGMGKVPVAPPNYYLGHDSGIESVPETGIYKLHKNETVTPAYDATKNRSIQLTIQNLITSETVAAAMQSKEGQGVIVNVIRANKGRNGIIQREVIVR
jgi:hypothetical protein